MHKALAAKEALTLIDNVRDIDGSALIAASVTGADMDTLREMTDVLRQRLGSAVIVLGSVWQEKPIFLAAVTPDLVKKGYHAGNIVKRLSQIAGGGGGGKPNMAQGGGRDKSKLQQALDAVSEFIR